MKTSTEKMIGRITFSERSGSTMRQQSERVPDSAEKTVRDCLSAVYFVRTFCCIMPFLNSKYPRQSRTR